jgi:hypothetical protein
LKRLIILAKIGNGREIGAGRKEKEEILIPIQYSFMIDGSNNSLTVTGGGNSQGDRIVI